MVVKAFLFLAIFPFLPYGADDLDSVPTMQLLMELQNRGLRQFGCAGDGDIVVDWSPPNTGSPVMIYWYSMHVQGISPDTTMTFARPPGTTYVTLMVAGMDSLMRQGPWSDVAEWPE